MTTLTRWNPFEELAALWPREVFGRLRPNGELSLEWNPRCDVSDNGSQVVVHAELPGVEAKDIEVSVLDSSLTIRGEKKVEKTEERDGQTYSERFFGSFERSLAIPEVDQSRIEAVLKDGVLEVRLPKAEKPVREPHKVEIKAG
jgi:HSP20 family protein